MKRLAPYVPAVDASTPVAGATAISAGLFVILRLQLGYCAGRAGEILLQSLAGQILVVDRQEHRGRLGEICETRVAHLVRPVA